MQQKSIIAIEGIDGSGKTTVAKYISKYLKGKNCDVFLLESGGLPANSIVTQIKKITHNPENKNLSPITETFLYAGRLAQRIREYIIPVIEENRIIVVDRFLMSVLVLAIYGRKQPRELIFEVIKLATQGVKPNFTILCDLNANIAIQRIRNTSISLSRKESEGVVLLEALREGYLEEVKKLSHPFLILKTDELTKEEEFQRTKEFLEKFIRVEVNGSS